MSRIKQTKKTTKFDPKIDISNDRITEFEIKPNKVEDQKNSLQEVISVLSQLSDEQMINGLLFKQVFFTIEAKLTELQDRMDNRDQLQELNSRYVQIKNLSPNNEESSMIRNKSQMSIQVNQDAQSQISSDNMKISPQSRSHTKTNLQIREKDSARDYSRMNILEKRIKQIEDKFTKSFKEFQEQQLIAFSKYDKQLTQIIEKGNSPYSKKDQPLDLGQKVQELYDSYRILIGHIKDIKGEINELNHSVQKQQEATHHQNVDQIRTIEQITTQQQESIAQIMAIQQNFTSLDADLIEILKSYKDLLNEVYRIDIMQQQLKRLQTYYDSQR